jgi:hypothetical protein
MLLVAGLAAAGIRTVEEWLIVGQGEESQMRKMQNNRVWNGQGLVVELEIELVWVLSRSYVLLSKISEQGQEDLMILVFRFQNKVLAELTCIVPKSKSNAAPLSITASRRGH